ncbi:MAG: hypothetical protein ACQKBT_05725, partial [Puniceicoccales bacterium]
MPDFIPVSLAKALKDSGRIPFVDFVRIALYDPAEGYYRKDERRVGATRQADFQTNLAVRSVFAPLVVEAVRTLLEGKDLSAYRFLEVAAEPETSLMAQEDSPFGETGVVRLGDPLPGLSGETVLFANEWLDAQPFVRMVFEGGEWREVFVERVPEEGLREV